MFVCMHACMHVDPKQWLDTMKARKYCIPNSERRLCSPSFSGDWAPEPNYSANIL